MNGSMFLAVILTTNMAASASKEELITFGVVESDGVTPKSWVKPVEQGAATYEDAHIVAARISTSALVKTALYGEDAKYALLN